MIQQMNAQTGSWEEFHEGKYKNYLVEPKYDGERGTFWKKPSGEVVLYTRHISKKTGVNVEKQNNVPHLVDIFNKLPKDTVIDGEVIFESNGVPNFKSLREIMGCSLPGKAVERQIELGALSFKAFDVLKYDGIDFTGQEFFARRRMLESCIQTYLPIRVPEYELRNVSISPIYNIEDIESVFSEVVSKDGEGVMLKNKNSIYYPGKRPSQTWIKLKRTDSFEAVIMGFTSPKEWYAEPGDVGADGLLYKEGRKTKFFENGWFGAIEYGQYVDGNLIKMGQASGVDDDTRSRMSKTPDYYIGKVAEFECMGRSSKGVARHPAFKRMRPDKNSQSCIFDSKATYFSWTG